MRTLCDVCESAPASLFCAADEAALCLKCDEKVHGCNKLASRHVRLQLAEARAVPRCDICESAPAFFFCGVDGTSLCLQCDMDVHTGGKKTHERYLMLGQRVELPTCKNQPEDGLDAYHPHKRVAITKSNNSDAPAVAIAVDDADNQSKSEQQAVSHLIDLNSNPLLHQQAVQATHTSKLRRSRDSTSSDDDECAGVVPQVADAQRKEASS